MPFMTRDEFQLLYDQGPDAVYALIQPLFERLAKVEEQLARNSNNSSKPPSSDGFSKPPTPALKPMPQSLRQKSGKKPGGQKGHTGKTLLPVENPDQVVLHRPTCCPKCQRDLKDAPEIAVPLETPLTRRQVFDLPPPRVVVTEHRALTLCCPGCGHLAEGTFPQSVKQPVQYGPHLLGFAAYLHSVHLLPFARCARIVQDVTGATFSAGSLSHALQIAADRLGEFEQGLKQAVLSSPVLHGDETGGRVSGKLQWFHVRCTPTLCHLFRHPNRGKKAQQDLKEYNGRLVSDFYTTYVKLDCSHLFCGAHLLRDLTFAHEVLQQSWAGSLKTVLLNMVVACHRARYTGESHLDTAELAKLTDAFDTWVKQGMEQNPLPAVPDGPAKKNSEEVSVKKRSGCIREGRRSKARCLLDRLTAHRDDYLAFLFDLSLPFTNNEAERDLRMLKVKAKVSGTFRTDAGADGFCRLRSYTQTCYKQGMPLFGCLSSIFDGQPILPKMA